MNDTTEAQSGWRWLSIIVTVLMCGAILGGAVLAIQIINENEPTAQKLEATRKSSALVETVTVKRGTFSPTLVVLGTVEPAKEIILSPRVSGQVTKISPNFMPGGMVQENQELLKIDPADFDNTVSIRKSELEQAEASLKIEEGRQSLAKKELKLLEGTIEDANRDLVLRKPQIASIKAEVSAAQAAVERANLDLQRTSIKAPFDAQILTCSVNEGSQVSPGDELARLVGIEEYWVMASVPIRSLNWIVFPADDEERGSEVTLKNPDTWPVGAERTGYVKRMIGTLNQRTRLARVLITVKDPLALSLDGSYDAQMEQSKLQPLILDSLIETHIAGRSIQDVIRLKREYVRDQDTVWVMKDEKLEIRKTEIEFQDATHAYIRTGLEEGEEVVTTNLATVAEGIGLRKYTEDSGEVDEENKENTSEETSD